MAKGAKDGVGQEGGGKGRAAKPAREAKGAAKPARAAATAAGSARSGKAQAKPTGVGKPAPKATRATSPAKRPARAEPVAPAKPRPTTTATVRAAPRKAPPARPAPAAKTTGAPARPRTRKRPAPDPSRLERLVAAAVKSLEDDKAEQVVVLDVTGRASFTDRLVIATGLADRQIQAMAAHLDTALGEQGLKLRRDAIQASDEWVLIDAGDLVIHLFKPDKRAELDLEKMWGPDSPAGEAPGQLPI
jgi:ribosome silencing factor RsfS/YbeB/iojap